MADKTVPHFHNDMGATEIQIGAHSFQCMGAKPPYDHPHIYLDMGRDTEIICPYCSTLYKLNSSLAPAEAVPAEAAYETPDAA
jgi:uncharacterized Zn-finger protein